MMTLERKEFLLELLHREGRIEAKAVSAELGLSDDTIRRDLRELAAAGKLQRVHGGALPTSPAAADLDTRQTIASASKTDVGKIAAELIHPNQVVILDGGTTALQIVKHLRVGQKNTVVTHSPCVAVELAKNSAITVIMIGGVLYRHSMVNVGAAAIDAMSHIQADTYFMGVTGVEAATGLTTGDLEEAHIKKALSQRAADTVVLASQEKINVASPFTIMPLQSASGIVLDSATHKTFGAQMRKAGLDVYSIKKTVKKRTKNR